MSGIINKAYTDDYTLKTHGITRDRCYYNNLCLSDEYQVIVLQRAAACSQM